MSEPIYAPGMRLQLAALAARTAQGMPRRGWKIGINVPEVQQRLGLSHALVGFLDGAHVLDSDTEIYSPESAQLKLEPELCLTLGSRVVHGASHAEARAAISQVQPALELVDYTKPMRGLDDLISHSMFHHGIVLGAPRPLPSPEQVVELGRVLRFDVGGKVVTPSRSDLIPADLSELVLLVARLLGEFGESLQPGDLLMSGAFVDKAVPLLPGQAASADFGALGEVRVRAST